MNQPFAELARQLLDVQEYPDLREYPDGPPEQPYDAAGWTLHYLMGVKVVTALTPLSDGFRSAMRPFGGPTTVADAADADGSANGSANVGRTIDEFLEVVAGFPDAPLASTALTSAIEPPPGRITGSGSRVAIDPAQNNGFTLIQRVLAAGGTATWSGGGEDGRYLVSGVDSGTLEGWARELGVQATRTGTAAGAPVARRVALYKPWRASMDEGWTRWLFDTFEIGYTTITNSDFAAGSLRDRFDVIILASDGPAAILDGFATGSVPARYAGGIGDTGVRELDAFVRAGGTLVCLNQSTALAINELRLPVRNVLQGVGRREFFADGSILEVATDASHPVMAGMPERASIFFDSSPAFEPLEGFEGHVLATYAAGGSPLLSGYLLGEERLHGKAAALDVRHGAGRVVLIGFRPQWRGQPFGTFRVLFNAALYGESVGAVVATGRP
jgi:hypothetical protein